MAILSHPLEVKRRICFIQTSSGWQTYVFDELLHPHPYKLLSTKEELNQAIVACKDAGWVIQDSTTIVQKLRQYSR